MTKLTKFMNRELEPFDLLFRNLFESESLFLPMLDSKISYPVDIYEEDDHLFIEIAVPGLVNEDINIEECNRILSISYKKEDADNTEPDKRSWINRNITKRSFNLSWKISDKFNLKEIEAEMLNGLLKVKIPRMEPKEEIKNVIEIK